MTKEQFNKRLTALTERVRKSTVALVRQARDENADGMCGDKPVDFADSPEIERLCDSFCMMGAFLQDRLTGLGPTSKLSVSRKVRKALGYT